MDFTKAILKPVIRQKEIEARVGEISASLDSLYARMPVVAVCVLKGAFLFFSDLVRRLHNPFLEVDFVRLSSYGKDTRSSGHVTLGKDVEVDIRGKHVLIVEDIVDTGHSMKFLVDLLAARNPADIKVVALVDKQERREVEVPVIMSGFSVDQGFLVGYGMDYAEHFRHLPDICDLSMPEQTPERA